MRKNLLPVLLLPCLLTSIAARSQDMTEQTTSKMGLADYLGQVRKSHAGLQGSVLVRDGAKLASGDANLLVEPNLFANVTFLRDNKEDPIFQTTDQVRNSYSLGVSELTTFGLQTKLSYNFDYSHYEFAPGAPEQPITLNQGRPSLEVTQSLWRNGFGTETRAQVEYSESSALATSFNQSYQARVILSQAEGAYWALSLARSSVEVTARVLDRAQKLYDWNARRVKLRLADESDLIQADALLKLRALDYQQSQDDARNASRGFNQYRGVDTDVVTETVAGLGPHLSVNLEAPARAGLSENVRAAQQQQRAAIASATLSNEKAKPTLDLFANASLNGSDKTFAPSISNSFRTDQPTVSAGVRFVMPLDFGTVNDAHRGYAMVEQGAERDYQRKFFDQENSWHDLTTRLAEAKQRYDLALKVEAAELLKLKVERERLNRGKTTTFQVIQFEQDAAQSELSTLRAQNDILQLIAQLKTFGGPI